MNEPSARLSGTPMTESVLRDQEAQIDEFHPAYLVEFVVMGLVMVGVVWLMNNYRGRW